MLYRPNFNTQSKKDAVKDYKAKKLTNSFTYNITKEF